ncbi:hypothetical protein E4635_10610 [Flavobacterium humi]|uniref:Alpha-ketoglutarate decarboxylase n=2 Tax=Flavobacterium humi TaxID=2562683 RepID=A0A4Z0L570_9FLAO|nr:hypothetical protein E4635_10610 [Flavobacterium humi]
MKQKFRFLSFLTRIAICVCFFLFLSQSHAQDSLMTRQKSEFWKKVRFGAGLGLGFGSEFTNISVAPSAIYDVNDYFSVGLGVQYGYVKQKNVFNSHLYGASLITLVNPVQEVQLSAELEQLRVNNTYSYMTPAVKDDFWSTALFLGAGYCAQNVTVGVRYNVLYKEADNVYSQAWMPFVRVYF